MLCRPKGGTPMLRSLVLGLTASLALAGPSPAQTPAPTAPSAPAASLTVDEIVAKNIQARGGLDKLKAVKSVRMTGHMTIGPGTEAPMVIEVKRPDKLRLDVTAQGMTLTQAYDGKNGWQINPFAGNKNAEPMSADELKEAAEQADMDGPLVDWKAKGHKVELVGKEKVEGTDVYKLRVTLKDGNVHYLYLDADSYLDIKAEAKRTVRGTEVETEQTIGDYKDVGGLMIPHSFEAGAKGRPEKQKITVEKIEVDVPIDDSRFAMPAKKDEPAPKKAGR
jgi:outer membrane lipoprotein-sorting protein